MSTLPSLIKESGFNNLGVLSVLYLTRKNKDFFAGIFERSNSLYLIVEIKDGIYVALNVTNNNIEDLLRGKINLLSIIKKSKNLEFLTLKSDMVNIPSRLSWLSLIFIRQFTRRIYTIPNAYYYWNEFQYARKR